MREWIREENRYFSKPAFADCSDWLHKSFHSSYLNLFYVRIIVFQYKYRIMFYFSFCLFSGVCVWGRVFIRGLQRVGLLQQLALQLL